MNQAGSLGISTAGLLSPPRPPWTRPGQISTPEPLLGSPWRAKVVFRGSHDRPAVISGHARSTHLNIG